ncbi:MAG: CRISPR-associated helicase Cas3', partial [bacterium]
MTMENLTPVLAKKPKNLNAINPEETLLGHSLAVAEAFDRIFGTIGKPTRLTRCWLDFFRISTPENERVFLGSGIVAALLQDIGKANQPFQDILSSHAELQVVRHEHLSGLILRLAVVRDWLHSLEGDSELATLGVIGHHLRIDKRQDFQSLSPDRTTFRLCPKAIDEIFHALAKRFGIRPIQKKTVETVWSFSGRRGAFDAGQIARETQEWIKKVAHALKRDPERSRALSAIRAALIAADSAGSALVREGVPLGAWIAEAFDETRLVGHGMVEEAVIRPRLAQIQSRGEDFAWSDFQTAAETMPNKSLLLAPCGSGKTLAAWRWIKARVAEKPAARVIFLYPTRATATEGFRDYVSWAPEADAALMHGSSSYELADLFRNPEDDRWEKDFSTPDRLFALGFWPRRIFSATVDQFLGFMQNVYRSICLLPLLADSILVIDEVHSFDRSLFSALKVFLKTFDLSVLCMTASLPERRIQDLKDCGLATFPEDMTQYRDLNEIANMPRYQVNRLSGQDTALELARSSRESGKRVLWVVNTVARCQRLARTMGALCYHSAFRLMDRKERQAEVITGFQTGSGPLAAVTTQVCEMSLDLDADVLITEHAPLTSLIQRMGRCNRKARPGSDRIGQIYLYPPENNRPYALEEMEGVEAFLRAVDQQT